jgi:hypothetical protein
MYKQLKNKNKNKRKKDSTSLLLEWIPSKRQTTTNVGEDVGKKIGHNVHVIVN